MLLKTSCQRRSANCTGETGRSVLVSTHSSPASCKNFLEEHGFYKYNPGDIFRAHVDPGGWTGSGFDKDGRLLDDCFGDRVSAMTFLLYLNDEFEGGATRFFIPAIYPEATRVAEVLPGSWVLLEVEPAE